MPGCETNFAPIVLPGQLGDFGKLVGWDAAAWEPQPDGEEVIVLFCINDAAGFQGGVAPICPKVRMPPVWQRS